MSDQGISDFKAHEKIANLEARFDKVLKSGEERAKLSDMDPITGRELDAEIRASEARTDAKFAEMNGKLDLIVQSNVKLDTDLRANRSMTMTVGFSLAGLIIAITAIMATFIGLSGTMFSRGMQVRDIVKAVQSEMMPKP